MYDIGLHGPTVILAIITIQYKSNVTSVTAQPAIQLQGTTQRGLTGIIKGIIVIGVDDRAVVDGKKRLDTCSSERVIDIEERIDIKGREPDRPTWSLVLTLTRGRNIILDMLSGCHSRRIWPFQLLALL